MYHTYVLVGYVALVRLLIRSRRKEDEGTKTSDLLGIIELSRFFLISEPQLY